MHYGVMAYAIRQKSTGYYLPAHVRGKAFSFDVPKAGLPRLFATHKSAALALNAWLKGEWKPHVSSNGPDYDSYDVWYEPKPVAGRDPTDMEVVQVNVTLA